MQLFFFFLVFAAVHTCCGSVDEDEEESFTPNNFKSFCKGVEILIKCPITQHPMRNPYLANDGNTFELSAIKGWLARGHLTSPLTGKTLGSLNLIPNLSLEKIVKVHRHYCSDEGNKAEDLTEVNRILDRREKQLRSDLLLEDELSQEIFERKQTLSTSTLSPSLSPSSTLSTTSTVPVTHTPLLEADCEEDTCKTQGTEVSLDQYEVLVELSMQDTGFGWKRQKGGLKIIHVDPGGQAARQGVRVGWIITKIEAGAVGSEEEFKRAVALTRAKGDKILRVVFSTKWISEGSWGSPPDQPMEVSVGVSGDEAISDSEVAPLAKKEQESIAQPLGYWRIGQGGRDVVMEQVTGKSFEIHGGKNYRSPESSSLKKGDMDGAQHYEISAEDYSSDLLFWESMSEAYQTSRDAVSLIRCFYHRHNKSKLALVDKWSVDYQGQEVKLLEKITMKYGLLPPTVQDCKRTGDFDDDTQNLEVDTVKWANGDQYTGSWKVMPSNEAALPQQRATPGKGTATASAGLKKDDRGVVLQRKMHGSGVFQYASGDSYRGDFRNGMRHGYGEYFWPSGMRYYGEWKQDQRDGRGVFYDHNGRRTEDSYAKDKKSCTMNIPLTKVEA